MGRYPSRNGRSQFYSRRGSEPLRFLHGGKKRNSGGTTSGCVFDPEPPWRRKPLPRRRSAIIRNIRAENSELAENPRLPKSPHNLKVPITLKTRRQVNEASLDLKHGRHSSAQLPSSSEFRPLGYETYNRENRKSCDRQEKDVVPLQCPISDTPTPCEEQTGKRLRVVEEQKPKPACTRLRSHAELRALGIIPVSISPSPSPAPPHGILKPRSPSRPSLKRRRRNGFKITIKDPIGSEAEPFNRTCRPANGVCWLFIDWDVFGIARKSSDIIQKMLTILFLSVTRSVH